MIFEKIGPYVTVAAICAIGYLLARVTYDFVNWAAVQVVK